MDFTKEIQATKWVVMNVLVTAVQGALAQWAISGNKLDKVAVTGAIAAGLSAAWNLVIKPLLKSKGVL